MDWDKLKIFHTVAEASSFTKASTILNLSQSAISRQIQALESDLKVQLFERHARGLILTENGEYLFKSAHGTWTIEKDKEGHAIVTYEIEAAMKMFIPKSIANTLIKVNLPNMFKSYQEGVKELYSKK